MISISKEDLVLMFARHGCDVCKNNGDEFFTEEQIERCDRTRLELGMFVAKYNRAKGNEKEKLGEEFEQFFRSSLKDL